MLPIVTLAGLVVARGRASRWALHRLLDADRRAYDAAWADACAADGAAHALARLARACTAAAAGKGPADARQYLPPEPIASREAGLRRAIDESAGSTLAAGLELQPRLSAALDGGRQLLSTAVAETAVASLDQLMEQAVCADIFLRRKVRSLAEKANGSLLVASPHEHEPAEAFRVYRAATASQHSWRWATRKPPERALEKLLRSYDCDPSRLLDCCRQVRPNPLLVVRKA